MAGDFNWSMQQGWLWDRDVRHGDCVQGIGSCG